MKKIGTVFLLSLLAWQAGAQGWTDALTFSENDYLGTARSVGMGNAVTAVGGDLGSLTFNPAGSAVSGYSQFTISPGLGISTVVGQGTGEGFEDKVRTTSGRIKLPNFGAMIVFDTRNKTGLKRVSFGLVGNATRDYTNRLRATGTNTNTTLAGSLASQADGFSESVLSGGFYQSGIPSWETMVGYQGGLFDPIQGRDGTYIGITERLLANGDIALADKIGQYYGLQRTGYKYDLLMNFGLDFNDRFYLGANIGLTSINYRSDETRSEESLGGDFPSGFTSLRERSAYRDEGSGIYAKVGFIARPFGGLRIGAAIQTPTLVQIRETYGMEGRSIVGNSEMSQSSPQDEWVYNLTSPFRVNAGIAYTFGKVGLVSADYEFTDYRGMRLREAYDEGYYYDFGDANLDIQDFLGPVHALRVGTELKPFPEMAIRVGYNLTTGAQYNTLSDNRVVPVSDQERVAQIRSAVSFGLGYSSSGSFFADLALRFQYLPNEYITPYWYYYRDHDGNLYRNLDIVTPEICAQSALCNAVLTLGWRF